jgi:hypothetical protein
MSTLQGVPPVRIGNSPNNLPFTIQYSSFPNSQLSCQNNINSIPNGPLLPTKPLFPSSLPPSLSQYPSSIQTNFINVKREACICSLRTSNLIIDSGFNNSTFFQIKNIPELKQMDRSKKLFNLILDSNGKVFKTKLKLPSVSIGGSDLSEISSGNPFTSISNKSIGLSFDDPIIGDI